MSQLILSIDLGTSGPKVAVFDSIGKMCCHTKGEVSTQYFSGGGAEQLPSDWEKCIEASVKSLLAQNPGIASQIGAINCTSQWSGTVALSADGKVLHPALIWMDSRGIAQQKKLVRGAIQVSGYSALKLWRWIRLTGGAPGHAGKDPISHILWIKEENPEIYRQTQTFLEPKDYLGFFLTGNIKASYDSITLHWLTDNRNLTHIDYDAGLLKLSGIDRKKLPDLLPPLSVLGKLRSSIAQNWGLSPDIPVGVGTPDIHSALVGSGAVGDYEGHLYLGTSSRITCHDQFKKTDVFHQMTSIPSAIPGRYLIANEQEAAGVCLQFLRSLLLPEVLPARDAYQKIDEWAHESPPGANGLLFLPWLLGERTPVENHALRSAFYNQSIRTTRQDYARAVLEGVALNSRWLLKYVEKYCGKPFPELFVVGGGAVSSVWCQIYADILGRTIVQPDDPLFANARGTALLMSMTMGWTTRESLKAQLQFKKTYTPNPAHRALYDKRFEEFLKFYRTNASLYQEMNRRETSSDD